MAGFGFGLLSIDVPSAESAPTAVSWAVFCWWAVSGVISAFAGGWAAANFSPTFTAEGCAAHGLLALALATLLVVAAAGFSASNSIAGGLAGTDRHCNCSISRVRAARNGASDASPARTSAAQYGAGNDRQLCGAAGRCRRRGRRQSMASRERLAHDDYRRTTEELGHGFRTWRLVVATWGTLADHHSARALLALTELTLRQRPQLCRAPQKAAHAKVKSVMPVK